ncbi:MAG: DUF454 family protein [Acidimicrobiia bacterium]|nr:DUF454 family protein [Acidimicrobiia bacterium]
MSMDGAASTKEPETTPATEATGVRRTIFTALGLLFSGLAIAGTFVPGLPTTINVLIAGYFFAKSSPRFDAWLTSHKVFGPIITDYRSGRGLTIRMKTISSVAMSVSIFISTWIILASGAPVWVGFAMALAWAYALWFILHQPTAPPRTNSE